MHLILQLSCLILSFNPQQTAVEDSTRPPLADSDMSETTESIEPGDTVVVTKDKTPLKIRSMLITTLPEGKQLKVSVVQGNWIWVLTEINEKPMTGWVHVQTVELLKPHAQTDPDIPQLLEPKPQAVMDNGRHDRADSIIWDFKWSEVKDAEAYELFVIGANAKYPVVKGRFPKTSFRRVSKGSYVIPRHQYGWTWKVRAIRHGKPLPWSEVRTFDVEPLDTDPQQESDD